MTIKEVFEMRKQGRIEEAYDEARKIYSTNAGLFASSLMFWTAVDILKLRITEDRVEEAKLIYKALERLIGNVTDEKGWMRNAMQTCHQLIDKGNNRKRLFDSGPRNLQMGIWGENLAVAYLRKKGYIILERDWRSKHRDIDIIAKDKECIVFVEVKTRHINPLVAPIEAVDDKKIKNLCRAINHYIQYKKLDTLWRFDIITIEGNIDSITKPEISHIKDISLFLTH